jgi:DNA-binding transcriptional ArsR family regulator
MDAIESDVFRALADPTRRGLYERLAREGELSVRALTVQAGVSQPAVSQHLAALKSAGLVRDRRDGRLTHYSAAPEGLAPLTNWIAVYGAFWRERIDRLERLLQEMDQ